MNVPFVDLKAQYRSLKDKINASIQDVINETAFIGGKYVKNFERQYAEAYGVKHCISCANGTDAIYISLKSLGVGLHDEVITVANSWISTSETISQAGAKPVFIDIDPEYYTIDASKIEEKITRNTKAIIAVHLYGQPAEIDRIRVITDRHNLYLIEDCAQAHFAEYKGQKVGTFGIAGTFSFYPGKNLGAYGDAGAIVTNDDEFANKARMFANHGALIKHCHEVEGINSRMDGIQAAILSVKLPHTTYWNQRRHHNAILYNSLLADVEDITSHKIMPAASHVFHLYVIRTGKRDELKKYLAEHGIATGIHYPKALPFLKAYDYLGYRPEVLPVAFKYQSEILSLPMYPELSQEQIEYVVETIKAFFRQLR